MTDISKLKSLVFKINTSTGSGSGFYLKEYNLIVTNHHVVGSNKQVSIQDDDKNRFLANVVMINPQEDIAFLRCESPLHHDAELKLASSPTNAGDKVNVLGFPYGMPYSITEGVVSSPNQLMSDKYYLQTDAAVNPGNSGGPIVNKNGELVGITTMKFTDADNMGFGVLTSVLKEELKEAHLLGSSLGVKCSSCNSLIVEKVNYCESCGAEVDEKHFDETPKNDLEQFVEDAIKQLNVNPVLARAGREYWEFHHGSALVRLFVYSGRCLFATSPINKLPKQNMEDLCRYIISAPSEPYQLGISENQIYLSYRFAISDIYSSHKEEIKNNLTSFLTKCDEYDDVLEQKFGCEKTSYAKAQSN